MSFSDKELERALQEIDKKFGKEAIASTQKDVSFLPTGSIGLDIALGGGWARGRVVELYGWESSGKSTLALHACAEAQKDGGKVAYIDMEHAFDPEYARNLGVDVNFERGSNFIFAQPEDGETGLGIVRELLKVPTVKLIIFDSVGALNPKARLQGEIGDAKMGLEARLMSSSLPMLIADAKKYDCVVMFINQMREKIGVVFGNPETTMAGNALKFYASQRVKIQKIGQPEKEGDEEVANQTRIKVSKNKVAPPFKSADFLIRYGEGIDQTSEVLDLAVDFSIVKKSGSWYSYGDAKLGQGSAGVRQTLLDNPELFEEIKTKLYETLA